MSKGKELDPVIWARAWQVLDETHKAGLELSPQQILDCIHIRPNGKRISLCDVRVHPANSEEYRTEDVAGNKPHHLACEECRRLYRDMVWEEGRNQVRNYWAKPNAAHPLPKVLDVPQEASQVEYEQQTLF